MRRRLTELSLASSEGLQGPGARGGLGFSCGSTSERITPERVHTRGDPSPEGIRTGGDPHPNVCVDFSSPSLRKTGLVLILTLLWS